MCGIAGIIGAQSGAGSLLQAELYKLNRCQKHRGPDDEGVWLSALGVAGLAHVRLAILDISPAGHQPMLTPDGRYVIVFNGEIFNFRELRAELEGQGVVFQTHTDTEVLLRMYEAHGSGMLARLRGMFAFCIWDQQTSTAFLARDPLGIKPLYYSVDAKGRVVFASELRALRSSGLVRQDLDGAALAAYFESGSVPEPMTLLKDVRCLNAGTWLRWQAGKLDKVTYWTPCFAPPVEEDACAPAHVRASLLDSVRHHFVSDVPVGIFLSGGIDSTALVALAREAGHEHMDTFSIGVDDAGLDESTVARETAAHFGTRHHELRLTGKMAEESFAEFLVCGDQPSIDGFNTFTVSRFARSCGMKVVLSGLGGDEFFRGYPSFSIVPRMARMNHLAHCVPGLAPVLGGLLQTCGPSPRLRRLGSMFSGPDSTLSAYKAFRGVFSTRSARVLARRYASDVPEVLPETHEGPHSTQNALDQVSELEITRYMRNQLLKDSDVMSMAHGLELRVPFVDSRLLEAIARLPASQRLRSGKQMLLEAVPEIPAAVACGRKRGFIFPFEKWLETSWGHEFASVAGAIPDPRATWYQRWALFVFERWLQKG